MWVVDETFFGVNFSLFIVTNLKTRAILGLALKDLRPPCQRTQTRKRKNSKKSLQVPTESKKKQCSKRSKTSS